MIKGQEVQIGFVPSQIYKVICHKVDITQSAKGFKMAKLSLEIIGPETAEAAGVTYKTLGVLGSAYAMLENSKGVDPALNMLMPSLKALDVYEAMPKHYGQSDVEEALKTVAGGKFNMLVQSQTEYATDNPEDRWNAKLAKRDEHGELIVKRYTPQFEFSQVRGGFEPAVF